MTAYLILVLKHPKDHFSFYFNKYLMDDNYDEEANPDVVDDDENYLEMLRGLAPKESKKKYDFEKSSKYSGIRR